MEFLHMALRKCIKILSELFNSADWGWCKCINAISVMYRDHDKDQQGSEITHPPLPTGNPSSSPSSVLTIALAQGTDCTSKHFAAP